MFTAYTTLLQGKLSPTIVPHTELIKTFRHIHSTLFIHRLGFHLLHNAPTYIYQHAEFKLHKSNRSILILVKFPLGSHDQPMKLFKILHYPIPLTNTSSHATQIANLPAYLAISHLKDSYTVLPDSALNECSFNKSSVNCHFSVPLRSKQNQNCAFALYRGNKTGIHNLCKFRVAQNSVSPYIRQLNEFHFLSVNNTILTVSCQSKTHILNDCFYCIVRVPCDCAISTTDFYFPERHTKCHHHAATNSMSVMHPVNFIVLHKFFGLNAIANITADTTFPTNLNISIKPIRYYDQEFSKLVAKDQCAHLDLDRLVQRAKENKVIYQDLVEPFINSKLSESSVSSFEILSIISVSISVLAIIATVFMYRKYKKVLAVVTLLHHAGHSSAYPTLPSFIYTETPTVTPSSVTQDIHVHIHNFSSYVILVFGLLVILYILFQRIRNPRPTLMIDITNGMECATCFIMHLPLCIQCCHLHLSLHIQILNVQGILKPSLVFDWGDLAIFSENNEYSSLTLPSTVRISIYQAYKIRKTLKRGLPLITQLWACHQNFGMPIKFCESNCSLETFAKAKNTDRS